MNRILIVEDDEAIANLLRMNLMKSGYECEMAEDGEGCSFVVASAYRSRERQKELLDEDIRNLMDKQGMTYEQAWEEAVKETMPPDKTDVTGISYEPWHFRYVGTEAAREITEQGITLEEYISLHDLI